MTRIKCAWKSLFSINRTNKINGIAVVYHQFRRNCISSTSKEVVYHQADINTHFVWWYTPSAMIYTTASWWYTKLVGLDKKTLVPKNESFLEVPPRFELGNNGFADRGLTTWLWHHILFSRGDYYNRVKSVCQEQIAKKILFFEVFLFNIIDFYPFVW